MNKRIAVSFFAFVVFCIGATACGKGSSLGDEKTPTKSSEKSPTGITPTKEVTNSPELTKLPEKTENDFTELSEKMAAGDFSVWDCFSEKMKAQLTKDSLMSAYNQTVQNAGTFLGVLSTEKVMQDGSQTFLSTMKFENTGLKVSYVIDQNQSVSGLWMNYCVIVEPEETDLFWEEKISVGEYQLSGLMTHPKGVRKPPVVILIQGSGASDLNETIGSNQPFRDIAHGLAEEGIASVRFNKRYKEYPQLASEQVTIQQEVIEDVNQVISQMLLDEDVDGNRIYLLGHSLGGMIAPHIALLNPKVAGVILMAGSPRNLLDIVYDQNKASLESQGLSGETLEAQLAILRTEIEKAKAVTESSTGFLLSAPSEYWYSLNRITEEGAAEKLSVPMLILQGTADFQVSVEKDYEAYRLALKEKSNCSYKLYENLNHLFIQSNGKKDESEYQIKGIVDPTVVKDIASFLLNR